MPTRIAFLNTHPIQYYAPLYANLNRADDLEITALYLTDISLRGRTDPGFGQDVVWDVDLLAGYEAVFVGDAAHTRERSGFWSLTAPEIWGMIRRARYGALVIHGHSHAANLIALAAARSVGTKVFYRADTHLGKKRSGFRRWLRPKVLGPLLRRFDGCLAIGQANSAFYRAMGVPADRIHLMPFAVDNTRYAEGAALTPAERTALRAQWGVADDRPVITFAAKIVAQKRPEELIEACGKLAAKGLPFHLLIVGSGPLQAEMEALAARVLPPGNFTFPGFVNQSALPRVFGASDVFVLNSTNEAWGLAVNEAMAAGLPVVVCDEIGAAPDLVRQGENGFALPAGDVDAIADALAGIVSDPRRRAGMADASRRIIDAWSFRECEEGLRRALTATAG